MPFTTLKSGASEPEIHPRKVRRASEFLALRSAVATAVLLLIFASLAFPADSPVPREVFILMAGHYGLPAYDTILHEVRAILNARFPGPVNYYAEYLDVLRFPSIQKTRTLVDFYNQKYGGLNIDLVIALGPSLAPIVDQFGDKLFMGAPTVVLDLVAPGADLPTALLKPGMTGVFASVETQGMVEAALALHPDTEHLVLVSGESDMDRMLGALALRESRRYEGGISVRHIGGMPMADILRIVHALPDRTVVLATGLHMDVKGVFYYGRESTQLIAAEANAPCYVFWDTHVDVGSVGGYVLSLKTMGIKAGEIALRILGGEDPGTIPPVREGLYQHQFDWRQLKRWGISEKRLPVGSVVLNRQATFLEQYFRVVLGVLVFVAFQSALIAYLVILNRRRKALTLKVRKAEDRYRELLRIERSTRLGELAGSLAHELNQPLTAISNGARAALRYLKADKLKTDTLKDILQNIVDDDKRAASVVRNVSNMLKKRDEKKKPMTVERIVDDVVALFRSEAYSRGIEIETRHESNLPHVVGNENQIRQVLLNLILNAADAVSSNISADKKIVLNTRLDENMVQVSVRDFGRGIDRERLGNIFQPFFSTKTGGMGIGLAVCETIMRHHGGNIRAVNNKDGGATFTFELPRAKDGG